MLAEPIPSSGREGVTVSQADPSAGDFDKG